jgi:hypothetical protein
MHRNEGISNFSPSNSIVAPTSGPPYSVRVGVVSLVHLDEDHRDRVGRESEVETLHVKSLAKIVTLVPVDLTAALENRSKPA